MTHDFWITISGQRGEEWTRIAGTNRFPVKSPIHHRANLPGRTNAQVYLLALEQMEASVLNRILDHLSTKFGVPLDETRVEMERAGIPILAEDCTVTILNPQRWL